MAASKGYYIFHLDVYQELHLDVYQRKYESNMGVLFQLVYLPTRTQKAVANACYHLGIHNENQGMRYSNMTDN